MSLLFLTVLAATTPEAAATAQPAPAVAATQGVIAYPASFFAEAQPNTANDMIARLPGFVLDQGAGVRGFAGAAGNVLIDGERPTSKGDDLQSILRRIPASQVERIDVIRGGAPGIDMQGKTVIANVVRKGGASVTGLISVVNQFVYDGRNAPGIRLEGVRRSNGTTLEGSLVMAGYTDDGAGDGLLVRRDANGVLLDRADMRLEGDGQQVVATSAFETPLAGGKFRINGRVFLDRFFYGEEDVFDSGSVAKNREKDERLEGELGLRYGRDFGERTKLEVLFLQQLKNQDFHLNFQEDADQELFSNSRSLGETIGRASLNYRLSDTLSVEVGGEGAFNWLETETRYDLNGVPVALPAADVRVEERRGEVFGRTTWTPISTLTLEAGLRYEASRILSEGDVALEKSLAFAKPRLVATWSPNGANQVRVRVEREVGQLNFGDFVASSQIASGGTVTSGNPDLNPQQAWVGEIAYERRFLGNGAITVTLRHSKVTDAIDRAPEVIASTCPRLPSGDPDLNSPACTRFDRPDNIGDGEKTQAQIDFNLPLSRIGVTGGTLRGFIVWRNSEVIDPTTGETRRITAERPREWELRFSQDLPAWKLNWGVDVFGDWDETYYRYNRLEEKKLRAFVIPYVEYRPRRDIQLRLELQNFTQRDMVRTQQVYNAPRGLAPYQFRETRQYENGMMVHLRFRKTFG